MIKQAFGIMYYGLSCIFDLGDHISCTSPCGAHIGHQFLDNTLDTLSIIHDFRNFESDNNLTSQEE